MGTIELKNVTTEFASATAAGIMSAAYANKLDGIAAGATANQTDAYLLSRANHTGTQLSATISDFNSSVDARVAVAGDARYVRYDAAQTLTSGQQAQARSNIGAGSGSGAGTVTSVDMTVPGVLYSISGNPITGAGTLALALLTQAANSVLAGPASGAAATPTMRALVAADIPNLDAAKVTTGQFPIARLATGTPDGTKFVRDDGTLAVPAGGGGSTFVDPTTLVGDLLVRDAAAVRATNWALASQGASVVGAGSYYQGAGANLIDGNDGTNAGFLTNGSGQSMVVDLGQSRQFGGFRFLQGSGDRATAFRFDVSGDNVSWTTVASYTGMSADSGDVLLTTTTARYCRIYTTAVTNGSYWFAYSLEIFSTTKGPLARLPVGSGTQVLVGGTIPAWGTVPAGALPTSGVTAATYGSATQVPQVTVDAHGVITGVTNVTITADGTSVNLGVPQGTLQRQYTFDTTTESWTTSAGTLTSASGMLRLVTGSAQEGIVVEPSSASNIADGEVQMDLVCTTGDQQEIRFRLTDLNNHYRALFVYGSGLLANVIISKYVSSTYTQLLSKGVSFLRQGMRYRALVRFVGSEITVYVNGAFVSGYSDTSLTTGRIGGSAYNNADAKFDNVRVYSLASGWTAP